MKKLVCGLLILWLLAWPAFAHPGGTDVNGGHTDRSSGEYHYHHGYPEHDHVDGECPYDYDDRTGDRSGTGSGYGGAVAYASTGQAQNWFVEYTEELAARRATEIELKEIKADYRRNTLLSAVAGLSAGVIALIIQVRRSNKRMHDAEQKMMQHTDEMVARAKQMVMAEMQARVHAAELERTNLLNKWKMDQQERSEDIEKRRQKGIMFAKMARNASSYEQKIPYLERVICEMPDTTRADGLVYVPHDLSGTYYHREYLPCGVRQMVLSSKKNAEAYGLKQCPVCHHASQPTGDIKVLASPTGTRVYHLCGAYCAGYSAREIWLSEALQRGLVPCAKCNPPTEKPKVWF